MCRKHYILQGAWSGEYVRRNADGGLFLDDSLPDAFCKHIAPKIARQARRLFGEPVKALRVPKEGHPPALFPVSASLAFPARLLH